MGPSGKANKVLQPRRQLATHSATDPTRSLIYTTPANLGATPNTDAANYRTTPNTEADPCKLRSHEYNEFR